VVMVGFASVVIEVIQQHRIGAFKGEGHSPVAIDRHSPMVCQVAMQGVQSPAGQVHILRGLRLVQPSQQAGQLGRVGGLDARLGAPLEIGLKPFVPE
jgi:hypothetical protein